MSTSISASPKPRGVLLWSALLGGFAWAEGAYHSWSLDETTPLPSYAPYGQTQAQLYSPGGAIASTTVPPHVAYPGTRLVAASGDAANIIGGMTEAFLGGQHGVMLSSKELQCLSTGAAKLTAGVMDTAGRTAQTYKSLQQQMQLSTLQTNVASVQAGGQPVPVNPVANPIDPLIVVLELSQRMASMMEYEDKITRKCLKSDAKSQLRAASHHLTNMTFVGGRLVANGVDIVTELGQAIGAYDEKQYRVFGDNIGLAVRKVLLSQKSDSLFKVFHEPSPQDVKEVTSSLVHSLFDGDMTVRISTDGVTTLAPPPPGYFVTSAPGIKVPSVVPWTLLPASEVNVDLQQCIVGNQDVFKSAWTQVWSIVNKLTDTSSSDVSLPTVEKATGEGAEGFGALAISLLDVQIGLRRCGFNAEQEAILMDSIEAGKGFHSKVGMPNERLSKAYATKNVAKAVGAWEDERYDEFGKRMGTTLRELLLETFPKKYAVDGRGVLRKQVVGLAEIERGTPTFNNPGPALSVHGMVAVALLVPSLLLMAVLLRTRRVRHQDGLRYGTLLEDAEVPNAAVFERVQQEESPV